MSDFVVIALDCHELLLFVLSASVSRAAMFATVIFPLTCMYLSLNHKDLTLTF